MSDATDGARQALADARAVYEHAIVNHPRSQQKTLGPSETGNACDRCLISMLAGLPKRERGAAWLPTVGTAVHAWAEEAMIRHLTETGSDRWLPEVRVCVGELRGQPVYGTCDLFDTHTGTVIDLKVVGETTRKKVRADGSGCSVTYRRQVQQYGRGVAALGYQVNAVAVYFMGRNTMSLTLDRTYVADYDEADAIATLDRANQLAGFVDTFGVEAVLAGAPEHTGDEFSCTAYGFENPTTPGQRGLSGLIPA